MDMESSPDTPAESKETYDYDDSSSCFSNPVPVLTNKFTLRFEDAEIEKEYEKTQLHLFSEIGEIRLLFVCGYIWILYEMLESWIVESKISIVHCFILCPLIVCAHGSQWMALDVGRTSRTMLTMSYWISFFVVVCILLSTQSQVQHHAEEAIGFEWLALIGLFNFAGIIFSIDFPVCAIFSIILGVSTLISLGNRSCQLSYKVVTLYCFFQILCTRQIFLHQRRMFVSTFETQRLENRQKLSLISQAAHDCGTPIASISFALDCLRMACSVGKIEEIISVIAHACEMLLLIRSETLTMVKTEMGVRHEPNYNAVCVPELLKKCASLIHYFPGNDLQFEFNLDSDIPVSINTDLEYVWTMCMNYLSNAKKYWICDKGLVTVSVFEWNSKLHFEVEDQGVGVPDDQKCLLFKPFVQLQDHENGTGLGLYSVATKAKQLGGGSGVHDNPFTSGSVFWFSIPLITESPLMKVKAQTLILVGPWNKDCFHRLRSKLYPNFEHIFVTRNLDHCEVSNKLSINGVKSGNVVVCWRENFSKITEAAKLLEEIHRKFPISSLFLCQTHEMLSQSGKNQLKLTHSKCNSFTKTYIVKQHASVDNIFHAIRSRYWESSSACFAGNSSTNNSAGFAESTTQSFEKSSETEKIPLDQDPYNALTPIFKSATRSNQNSHFNLSGDISSGELVLIEDTPSIRKMVAKLLKSQGFFVHCAGDGQQGLELLKFKSKETQQLRCALVDLSMPIMDGVECITRFRQWEKAYLDMADNKQELLVMAFTAHGDEERKQQALDAGANAILPKPFQIHQMKEILGNFYDTFSQ